jgi:hypothetical protein
MCKNSKISNVEQKEIRSNVRKVFGGCAKITKLSSTVEEDMTQGIEIKLELHFIITKDHISIEPMS